uniref:TIR domain-containing protein n=1 Tax=Glycine max TaxID=3847 RepID=A0A0R0HG01_SOYBN
MASKTTIHCCFRGEDTRNSFTGFLFQALSRKGTIDAFKDGKDLKKGESIAPELIQAIQGSRLFFIVVFSNNYAFSTIRKKLQYAEIEDLEKITNILGHKFSSLPNDDLVGMESCVKELAKLLRLGSVNDIQVVGMSGIGGIGKTTLGHGFYAMLARELIVLDNVDQVGLLKMFPRSRDTLLRECLGEGGRIIIISRDKHILMRHGVDDVYQVQALDHEHAVQLVCRNAFKSNYVMTDYKKLAYDILSHAQGHPLAMKYWAHLFIDFRGFHPKYGLQVLIDRSLITIKYELIHMRDLLRDLGRYIVREKSPKKPRKWSRLWDFKKISTKVYALSKMIHLKLLVLEKMNFSGRLGNLSNELGYLTWNEYPFECLPPSFELDNPVRLLLPNSNIKQLWEGMKMPDIGEALNLEWLDLQGRIQLRQIDPSIGLLRKLIFVNFKDCKSLTNYLLPSSPIFPCICKLDLSFCNLLQIPDAIGNLCCLESLDLSGNNFSILPNLKELSKLFHLNLQHCKQLKHLPELPS